MGTGAFAQGHRTGGRLRLAHSDRGLSASRPRFRWGRGPASGSGQRRYRRHAAPDAFDGCVPDPRKGHQAAMPRTPPRSASAASICAISAPTEPWFCSTASAWSRPTQCGVDLSNIPNTIVQRVDVVTGGDSVGLGFGRGVRRGQHRHQQELYRPEGFDRRGRTPGRIAAVPMLHGHQRVRHPGRPQPYRMGGHLQRQPIVRVRKLGPLVQPTRA